MARKKRKAGKRQSATAIPTAEFKISPLSLRLAAAALLALLLAHSVVFGMRAVLAEKRDSSDAMNYISVARNLSAGEGFVQSAPGQNQFTFWAGKFSPDFPAKTRHTHSIGLPLLIYAVAELTGLEHADAARLINAAAYGLALALAGALAFYLWGAGGAMLSVAAISWLDNSLFYYPMTEPSAVVFMLACLLLLARPGGTWRFLAAGLLAAMSVTIRRAMAPVFVAGAIFCLLQGKKRWRATALFLAGCGAMLAGEFVGEGVKHNAYVPFSTMSLVGLTREVRMNIMLHQILDAAGAGAAALAGLGGALFWRRRFGAWRKGGWALRLQDWLEKNAGQILLPAWAAGFCAFVLAVGMFLFIEPLNDFRNLYPAKIAMAALGGGMAWAAMSGWRWRVILAGAVFTLSMSAGISRDWTALANRGDVSDAARIAENGQLRWAAENVRSDDFLVAHFGALYAHFLEQVDSAVAFTGFPYETPITAEHLSAVVSHRCEKHGRHLLIVPKNWNGGGPFMADLSVKRPVPHMELIAELGEGLVYRMTHCDAE